MTGEIAARNPWGVVLVNTGTPDAPVSGAVRRYLRRFLSDRRVSEAPLLEVSEGAERDVA